MEKNKVIHLAPVKKYDQWKGVKDSTLVQLLLRDDADHCLAKEKRAKLLEREGLLKKYRAARKKLDKANPKSLAEVELLLSAEEIVAGLIAGTIKP